MRDYKNVKVPRKYRTSTGRTTVKRVNRSRRSRSRAPRAAGSFLKFLTVAALAAACYLGWLGYQWFMHVEFFQVAGVDVKGVRHLGESDIRKMVSGLSGKNTFLVDLDEAARTARAHRWVKEARVYRSLPNRVSLVLTERVPSAVLDNGHGRYLVDDEGVVIEQIGKEGTPFPVVKIRNLKVRSGSQVTSSKLIQAMSFLGVLSDRGGWQLTNVTVTVNSPGSLMVRYGGHDFRLGNGDYTEKLQRLSEVLTDVEQRGLKYAYVDLRAERQVAVKIK